MLVKLLININEKVGYLCVVEHFCRTKVQLLFGSYLMTFIIHLWDLNGWYGHAFDRWMSFTTNRTIVAEVPQKNWPQKWFHRMKLCQYLHWRQKESPLRHWQQEIFLRLGALGVSDHSFNSILDTFSHFISVKCRIITSSLLMSS